MKRSYLYHVGLMSLIPIPLAIGSLLFALFYSEWEAVPSFLALTAIHAVIGWLLMRLTRNAAGFDRQRALMVPVLGCLIIILAGALPYVWLSNLDPLSAVLEAVSGYTTCGVTVFGYGEFESIESLPRALIFWHSATEWIGGILLWAVLGLLGAKAALSLGQGWGMERLGLDMRTLGRQIVVTYVGLTLASALLLLVLGPMSPFDALNHGMTALATGGFSTRNAGLAFYDQGGYHFNVILVVISLTSLAGMSSFVWLSGMFVRRQIGSLFRDEGYAIDRRDFALLFSLLLLVTGLLFGHYLWRKGFSSGQALRQAAFYSITASSGTGFNITDLSEWDAFTALVLIVVGIVGGSGYSASGGLSLATLGEILSALKRRFAREPALTSEASGALMLTILSLSLSAAGTVLLLPVHRGMPVYAVFYQVAAAQATTGPQLLDLATIPPVAKLLYMLLMVGGFLKYSLLITVGQRLISTSQQSGRTE
jgi:trk system potassium uptake protein TrkH